MFAQMHEYESFVRMYTCVLLSLLPSATDQQRQCEGNYHNTK